MKDTNEGFVIWITGLSGAGKTTVARALGESLNGLGIQSILLDGDRLRRILGNKWGYTVTERRELAHVYSRLCQFLSESGLLVICATVSMFEEVRRWNRENIARYFEVFLDVPIDVLKKRDTRGVYANDENQSESMVSDAFEFPENCDLRIGNFGQTTPEAASNKILKSLFSRPAGKGEATRSAGVHWQGIWRDSIRKYWDAYYAERKAPEQPSDFAQFCLDEHLEASDYVLDLGCGNGRDSRHLVKKCRVLGLDISRTAIEYCRKLVGSENSGRLAFMCGDLADTLLDLPFGINAAYSRFVLHAMTEDAQDRILIRIADLLPLNGKLLLEFRTTEDSLMNQGFALSEYERVTDHYRRFISTADLSAKLQALGFQIAYSSESRGVAVLGKDDPVVGRIIARKKH